MEYFILSVIVLIINECDAGNLHATENPTTITNLSSSEPEKPVYCTAVINEPLDIHFQNISIATGWCDAYYLDYDDRLETPKITNSTIHINNVTYGMSTLWKCTVTVIKSDELKQNLMNFKPKYYFVYINLHVKGAKSLEIIVNGYELTLSQTDLSVPYDGETIYFYENDERIDIFFKNSYGTGTVYLEDKKGAMNADSKMFHILPRLENNNTYIICTYNSIKPVDKYVYRINFFEKNQLLFSLNNSKTLSDLQIPAANQVNWSSSQILGISVGAVLIILSMIGAAYWYVRTRNMKHIETPYGDLTNQTHCPTPQSQDQCENTYDTCHYSESLSSRDTSYEKPEGVENIDPNDHYYAKIDYSKCTHKTDGAQTRNSKVYDEPYVHITLSH